MQRHVHAATMSLSSDYWTYYNKQYAGESGFDGGQHGAGLGDVLRNVFRWAAPIVLKGAATFASNAVDAHGKGATLKEAAKSAIRPSLGAMAQTLASRIHPAQQSGSGQDALFSGVQGLPYHGSGGYKGHGKKSKKSKKSKTRVKSHKRSADTLREPPPGYNF